LATKTDQVEAAEAALRQALILDKKSEVALFNLGVLFHV
jgi:Flp pilus assembly protein TadD